MALSTSISEYKGKVSIRERGWSLLPQDLLQTIATLSIFIVNNQYAHPTTASMSWASRNMLYALRDANELERLMGVCLGWRSALESHRFWQHAVTCIDPFEFLAHHAIYMPPPPANNNSSAKSAAPQRPIRIPPFKHFRNLVRCSCVPCRVNHPNTNHGLAIARQSFYHGPQFGYHGVCATHADSRPFCSICFRDSSVYPTNDYETFPGVPNVCRMCRHLARNWSELCVDDESRRVIDGFVTYGDGIARRVAEYCLDRAWLRHHTRIREYIDLCRANLAYSSQRPERIIYDSDDEIIDDSDDEDDEEERLDAQSRELALTNWAHMRVIDGFWILPTDQWHSPMHPITLARSRPFDIMEEPPSVSHLDPPPSYSLCEYANLCFRRELKEVLTKPFSNIVRKLVMLGGGPKDIQRLTLHDLGNLLREEGTWWEGWDWPRHSSMSDDGSDDSGPSPSNSASSTSPVLSTSTLQTTPSPPPKLDDTSENDVSLNPGLTTVTSPRESRVEREPFIPVTPVLNPPKPLRHIPWIPENLEELSPGSRKALLDVWAMACEPLYVCDCRTCARNAPKKSEENNNTITLVPSQDQLTEVYAFKVASNEVDADGEGEMEIDMEDDLIDYSSDDSMVDYVGDIPAVKHSIDAIPRAKEHHASPARKRSSEEVESLEHLDGKRVKRVVDTV